jgi:hypothetical protein
MREQRALSKTGEKNDLSQLGIRANHRVSMRRYFSPSLVHKDLLWGSEARILSFVLN